VVPFEYFNSTGIFFLDKILRNRLGVVMDEEILKGKTLLVVDDESDLRDIVASELEFMGANVYQAENITVAQEILAAHPIDLIVSDIRMPGGTGIDLLRIVKEKNVSAPVILITGFADITLEEAFDKGAEALIHKPFKLDDLIKMVVRYTSPFRERFNEAIFAKKQIKPLAADEIKFGRGGLVLPVETQGKRIDVGEALDFDFEYHDQKFSGQGICRWLHTDPQAGKAVVGLEFMNLDQDSLANFGDLFEGKKVVPYIPSVKH
jgi:CheY-like chemotaxis protein